MSHIVSVSYPRCGNHLILTILCRYLETTGECYRLYLQAGDDADDENYSRSSFSSSGIPFAISSDVPTSSSVASITLQKTHDFATIESDDLEKRDDVLYLLPYRNPMSSIASNYILHLEHAVFRKFEPYPWSVFVESQIAIWNKFMEKWHLSDTPNAFAVYYDYMLHEPSEWMRQIISFVTADVVNEVVLYEVMREFDVSLKTRLEDYRYYDSVQFAEWTDMTVWKDVVGKYNLGAIDGYQI